MKTATLYTTDGRQVDITPKNNKGLTYDTMRAAVAGMVEIVPMPNGKVLICNEEGKLIGLPENPRATQLWKKLYPIEKYPHNNDELVVGNVIIADESLARSIVWKLSR
jgi:hypothetical protein